MSLFDKYMKMITEAEEIAEEFSDDTYKQKAQEIFMRLKKGGVKTKEEAEPQINAILFAAKKQGFDEERPNEKSKLKEMILAQFA